MEENEDAGHQIMKGSHGSKYQRTVRQEVKKDYVHFGRRSRRRIFAARVYKVSLRMLAT